MIPAQDHQAVASYWQALLHLWRLFHDHPHQFRVAIGNNAGFRALRRALGNLVGVSFRYLGK